MSRDDSSATPSRRDFLSAAGAGAAALAAGPLFGGRLRSTMSAAERLGATATAPKRYPIGLELYSVRRELARDLPATLRAVADIGYNVVEFYAPYLQWTLPYAKEVRTQLDDLGLRCYSTHNSSAALVPGDTMSKAIELNQILGARHIIMASPPPNTASLEDWTRVSGQLAAASEQLKPHGLFAGFHNHRIEWTPLAGGKRVMDVLAEGTPPEFVLQFDVGTCLEAGADPIAWITSHPGRIRSVHLKDWAPGTEANEKGYRVLFGEGTAPWKSIFAAVESTGGVEFYLMEQEGSRYSELDTAKRCLATWRTMRGAS
ncbi:MAG TPA: sugar phosphate isomerase/epimerase [Gemmatimonadaceae bacterium]|nr:sugar phosphate isomerase/epimerase [Gemmatimonadaceae bacterium]